MRLVATLALAAFGGSVSLEAQAPAETQAATQTTQPVDEEVTTAVVTELASKLEDNFVFPDVGKAYAARLRDQLAAGAYSGFAETQALADKVTADLQALHKDGHLRLFAPAPTGAKSKYRTEPTAEGAIGKSGWLADGVAYIEISMFPSDRETLDRLRAFLDEHASAATLIIDIRGHHGGDISEIDLLASYLYPGPVVLAHLDTRLAVEEAGMAVFGDGPTLRRIESPGGIVRREHHAKPGPETALRTAKVYLLTSRRTVSAAEHLAMTLQRTGRATLIGETTKGAGHFGHRYKLSNGYSAFIPVGRSFDPDTGEGWEGTGVKPDVDVPADKALDEALKLAGVSMSGDAALGSIK